jgi:hypothetical protein
MEQPIIGLSLSFILILLWVIWGKNKQIENLTKDRDGYLDVCRTLNKDIERLKKRNESKQLELSRLSKAFINSEIIIMDVFGKQMSICEMETIADALLAEAAQNEKKKTLKEYREMLPHKEINEPIFVTRESK